MFYLSYALNCKRHGLKGSFAEFVKLHLAPIEYSKSSFP